MFGFNKKPVQRFSTRDMLFGDLPLSYWGDIKSDEEPWTLFKKVKKSVERKNDAEAINILNQIIKTPALESRHYLQAYFFLNQLQSPSSEELKIFGAVAEVSMPEGCDMLAVYADHSARYYNYSGSAVIWEHSDTSLDNVIDYIIKEGKNICAQIGPWKSARRPSPLPGKARINFLTSHGLHFGEANEQDLFNDPMGGKVMYAMADVMQTLINKTNHNSKTTAAV